MVRQVRKLAAPCDSAAASDAHLLDRFRATGDEAAFAALVRRHGPLVMGVCRRVLRHHQDAEDAFQATFLVLARNAASVRRGTSLASWLYGVARRVAGNVRRAESRRQARERRATNVRHAQPDLETAWRELQAVLAREVERLPEKYQLPFVLCCLEGRSKAEAAAQLGWKEGTVSSRLAEARKRMQQRLARRGLTLAAALCAVAAAADTASALPSALVTTTVSAALGARAGTAAAASARVAALANGVTKAMFASKVKAATALLLAVVLLATAVGAGIHRAVAEPPAREAAPPAEAKSDKAPAARPEKADAPADPLPAGVVLRLGATRLRHGRSVSQLALSPDGTKVAAYGGGQLSLWDTRTGGVVRRVELPKQAEMLQATLAWLADGRGIVLLQGADTRDVARLQGSDGSVWEFTDEKAVPTILPDWGIPHSFKSQAPSADSEADWCYAISPDGKTLAAGRGNNLVRDVGVFDPLPLPVSPEEGLGKERAILLRPLKTGAVVSELPKPRELARQPGNCKRLLFTPDGKRLVALKQVKDGPLVIVWDLASGRETVRFKAPRPTEKPGESGPRPMAVSDTAVAIGLEDGGTSLWDLATGKERKLKTDHAAKASWQYSGTAAVAFAPDGKTLATGGRDGLVKLWDVASGRHLRTLELQYTEVEALAWSRDGRTVASAGRGGAIRLLDAATGKDLCPQPGHLAGLFRVALSPDGKTAVTAGWDRTVRWWDTVTGRELGVVAGFVNELAVSPDSRTVLANVPEGRLRMWDLATGRETTPADLPDGLRFGPLAFTPDGRRLVTASGPHVTVVDWPGMKLRRSFDLPKPDKQPKEYECKGLAVSPDGRWLVTVAERSGWRSENPPSPAGGVIDLWDLGTGQHIRRLAEWLKLNWYFQPATMATFTADGRVMVAPGTGTVPAQGGRPEQPSRGAAALLDPLTPRRVQSFGTLEGHYYTAAIVVSPDGRTLYLSFDTSEIVAFEVATGQLRRTLYGHAGCVRSLAMAPDGRRLLSGSDDGFALLWDTTPAGAAKPRKDPLTAADADELWAALAAGDAQKAYSAMAELSAAPDRAVALVRRELKPAPAAPTDAELDRAFADLDSESFATREKASRQLAEFGEQAVAGVRKRLGRTESAEVRKRALDFLDRFDPPAPSPDRLRRLRAVEVLEGIATPAAREVLSELAKGGALAPLTLEASAALQRLRRR
jgi:RNA polymerase sigma factor (sigma-70 family)